MRRSGFAGKRTRPAVRFTGRCARGESGQGLVESAVVFTLLMLMILGLVDFGFIFQTYIGVVNAANTGATFSANAPAYDAAAIRQAALSESRNWRCTDIEVASTPPMLDAFNLPMVTVTVSCRVADLFALPESLHHLQIKQTATRRVRP